MDTKPRSVHLIGFATALLCAGSATAFAQTQPVPENTAAAQPPAAPQPPAAQPTAAPQAPVATPPAAPTGYQPPAPYYPPTGYGPPPGYYPPPGYGPPPGYYPPPGYRPGYYAPQDLGPPPGYHLHDGFYMRLTTGVGVLDAKYDYDGLEESVSGGGMAMTFAFGGAVASNLILYGELLMTVAMSPTLESGGRSQTMDSNVSLMGVGPGVAYYFQPSNMYLSGTVAFSQVTQSANDSSGDSSDSVDITDMGLGGSFMVGKEWWVSDNWGLGAAGYLHLASMKMKNFDSRMTAAALGVLFSATFN